MGDPALVDNRERVIFPIFPCMDSGFFVTGTSRRLLIVEAIPGTYVESYADPRKVRPSVLENTYVVCIQILFDAISVVDSEINNVRPTLRNVTRVGLALEYGKIQNTW
jgi:hypothetical protein